MISLDHLTHLLLEPFIQIKELTFALLGRIELGLRVHLQQMNMPYPVQTLFLLTVIGITILFLSHLLRGLMRVVAVGFLALLTLNMLTPYFWH